MADPVPLQPCEHALADVSELLWRQVHPRFVRNGVVMSEGFVGPQPGTSEISVVRSSSRTSQEAHDHHILTLGLESAGTWAASVGEVDVTGGRAVDDVECDGVDTPGHAFVDLRHLTKAQRKAARAVLATAATNRGMVPPA